MTQPAAPTQPLVGFRVWHGTRQGLVPLMGGVPWTPRAVEAAGCARLQQHHAPAPNCDCGLHGVSDYKTVVRVRRSQFWRRPSRHETVTGAVLMWGMPGIPVMVSQVKGRPGWQYRAPRAQILFLVDSPAARRIGRKQGIAVYSAARAMEVAAEYGTILPPPVLRPSPVEVVGGKIRDGIVHLWRRILHPTGRWTWPHMRAWGRHIWLAVWLLSNSGARLIVFGASAVFMTALTLASWFLPGMHRLKERW
jgi:hypothetical protein